MHLAVKLAGGFSPSCNGNCGGLARHSSSHRLSAGAHATEGQGTRFVCVCNLHSLRAKEAHTIHAIHTLTPAPRGSAGMPGSRVTPFPYVHIPSSITHFLCAADFAGLQICPFPSNSLSPHSQHSGARQPAGTLLAFLPHFASVALLFLLPCPLNSRKN